MFSHMVNANLSNALLTWFLKVNSGIEFCTVRQSQSYSPAVYTNIPTLSCNIIACSGYSKCLSMLVIGWCIHNQSTTWTAVSTAHLWWSSRRETSQMDASCNCSVTLHFSCSFFCSYFAINETVFLYNLLMFATAFRMSTKFNYKNESEEKKILKKIIIIKENKRKLVEWE